MEDEALIFCYLWMDKNIQKLRTKTLEMLMKQQEIDIDVHAHSSLHL